ncbi:MAG TPA: lysylphosphatidylglycerol synthase transmembrane domain-containing protein [Gemmatirosa sp.]|nr:lysylphosphatidylglycerol synthase transmembrane domain-containing protein [Gemmatirosa sp.]
MRLDWRSALGLLLSALLLWWTLHGEPLGEVWLAIRHADWALWALSTVLATVIFPMRAIRWRLILAPVAADVPYGPLWRATAIGMMANNLLPARAGEVARAFALAREERRVSFAAALASLAVDRLFDAIVVLLLLFSALLDPAFPSGARIYGQTVPALARGLIGITVLLLVALYVAVSVPDLLQRMWAFLARRVAPRFERRGARAIAAFVEGLGVLRHPGRFAAVFAWTLAHWLVCVVSIWIGFRAVGIRAPFSAALFLNGLSSVASALPSSPGFFGVFESVSKVSLQLYRVDPTLAISWALGYHILTFIPITVFGLVYMTRLGLGLGALSHPPEPADPASGPLDPGDGEVAPAGSGA